MSYQITVLRDLCQCLPSVLTSLDREATERYDAQPHGLALFVKFFYLLHVYFLSDILPHLAQLSRPFQKTSIEFSIAENKELHSKPYHKSWGCV